MSRNKTTAVCLVLFIAIGMPQVADSYPALHSPVDRTSINAVNTSASFANDNPGPRKKVKKKGRRSILNRKTKMKSGKHCPSF